MLFFTLPGLITLVDGVGNEDADGRGKEEHTQLVLFFIHACLSEHTRYRAKQNQSQSPAVDFQL